MKQHSRPGVFETNSSSTHSLVIDRNVSLLQPGPRPDENGVLVLGEHGEREFGWEIEEYSGFDSKVNYAYLMTSGYRWDTKEYKTDQPTRLSLLEKVIMEHTGAKKIEWALGSDGYVDHQSSDNDEMFENEQSLRCFLFSPHSMVLTDNDNH